MCFQAATVIHPVLDVFRSGTPAQILDAVVIRDVIEMTALHPLGAGTSESLQHEVVNLLVAQLFTAAGKCHVHISGRVFCLTENLASMDTLM